eukprot:13348211-Alexandrium_andersonii.AAC.1
MSTWWCTSARRRPHRLAMLLPRLRVPACWRVVASAKARLEASQDKVKRTRAKDQRRAVSKAAQT